VADIVSVWCNMVYMKLHSHSVSSSPVAPFHVVIHDIGKISARNLKYLSYKTVNTNCNMQDLAKKFTVTWTIKKKSHKP